MSHHNIEARIGALSESKRKLLALRLGSSQQAKNSHAQVTSLAAFVTAEDGIDESILKHHLETRLPQYMVPSKIVILDELPRTPNGKVDRQTLAALDSTHSQGTYPAFVAPRDDIEQELASIWGTVLGIDDISIHDDFFSLGGDSLQATRIAALVEKNLDITLRITTLFQLPTIAELAPVVREVIPLAEQQTIVRLQEGDRQWPILFLVHGLDGELVGHKPLIEALPDEQPVDGILGEPFSEENDVRNLEAIAAKHIEKLQTVQPSGPYYLAGYSFGGTLAYEMGRQLADKGEQIGFIGLFEPYLPYTPQGLMETVRFRIWRFVHTIQHNTYHLRKLEPGERFAYIKGRWDQLIERRKRAQSFGQLADVDQNPAQVDSDLTRELEDRVITENLHLYSYMIYRYQPLANKGNVLLFTTNSVFGALVRRAVDELVTGDIESHIITESFDHNQMMKPPMVSFITERLMKRLQPSEKAQVK